MAPPTRRRGIWGWLRPVQKQPAAAPGGQRYRDDGELARGGASIVRLATDHKLLRHVAMKSLDPSRATPKQQERFREEARVTAQLEHPNIPPVHDLEEDGGAPFMTMKLIRGEDLATLIEREPEGPRSPDRLRFYLEVLIKVCDALAFAHSRGVIHRDLKPANIMVGEYGEAYLMDWGLARVHGEAADHATPVQLPEEHDRMATVDGEAVGTLEYISPEQALGKVEELDERTDVFGVGAVLYHVLAGRPLYDGELPVDLVMKARDADFTPVDQLVEVPGRLAELCHKALAADPRDRFPSVKALNDELHAVLRGGLHMPVRTFAAGTEIVKEGEEGEEAFLIVDGRCESYRGQPRRSVRKLEAGDVFGEAAALGGERRTATVVAQTEVRALVVTREALLEELGFDRFAGAFVKALARRFYDLVDPVERSGEQPTLERRKKPRA